jgi:hypothetical protein
MGSFLSWGNFQKKNGAPEAHPDLHAGGMPSGTPLFRPEIARMKRTTCKHLSSLYHNVFSLQGFCVKNIIFDRSR